jgi:hypothetical protein
MDNTVILLCSIIALLLAGFLAYIFWQQRKETPAETKAAVNPGTHQLQLQAYERLTLLVDRIALPNIISRLNQPDVSAREMQMVFTQNIRQEFEYNITQQIYVSAESWMAIKNLKDQNMLIINQMAASLPANATGMDLSKQLLQFLMSDQKGNLHEVVSEVLSYEAKKLL